MIIAVRLRRLSEPLSSPYTNMDVEKMIIDDVVEFVEEVHTILVEA